MVERKLLSSAKSSKAKKSAERKLLRFIFSLQKSHEVNFRSLAVKSPELEKSKVIKSVKSNCKKSKEQKSPA